MAKPYTNDPYQPDPYAEPVNPGPREGIDEHQTPPMGRPGPRPPGKGPGFWQGNTWIEYASGLPPPGSPPGKGHWDVDDQGKGTWVMENGRYDESGKWVQDPGEYDEAGVFHPPGGPVAPAAPPTAAPPAAAAPPSTGGGSTTVQDTFDKTIQTLLTGGSSETTGTGGGTAPGGVTQAPAPPVTKAPNPIDEAWRAQMLRLLQGPTAEEVGATAGSSAPVNAFRNAQLRDLDRSRARAAEGAGISGTDRSGGFEGRVQGLQQAAGEATAKYAGDYALDAMRDRRAELQSAMLMAQNQGQFDDKQALELEIAKMDEAIRRESNANQRYATDVSKMLGMSDIDLRKFLGEMQNATSRYGINTTAGLGYAELEGLMTRWWNDWLLSGGKK